MSVFTLDKWSEVDYVLNSRRTSSPPTWWVEQIAQASRTWRYRSPVTTVTTGFTPDLSKGFFTIQVKDLLRKSVMQGNELSEDWITAKGCGYPECTSTFEDAHFQLSGGIL